MPRVEKISKRHKSLRLVFKDHTGVERRVHVSASRRTCELWLHRIEELVRCRSTRESPAERALKLPNEILGKLAGVYCQRA